MSRDIETKMLLAIEAAMERDDRVGLLQVAGARNRSLRGAKVADVLDIFYGADAFLERSEPFWETHTAAGDAHQQALAYALIAAALLGRDDAWVMRLADKAVANLT